jgi:hypothetical protein
MHEAMASERTDAVNDIYIGSTAVDRFYLQKMPPARGLPWYPPCGVPMPSPSSPTRARDWVRWRLPCARRFGGDAVLAGAKHAAGVIDPNKREAAEAANVRACRLAGAISRMSATYQQGLLTLQRKRTGGNQQVTVKHIHQQVNVTQGGQAVVAGDKVTSRARGRRSWERRRGDGKK